ncbi:hypothetical protein DV701_16050 [Ornithinimicrobium avium]|uniref:PH domain-containing protein n=2 Tax=Ornithinimicrobium avium TaxID=2283195 RepID=A0A345NQW2_9MICO|nr:hypothetical protein DV701_16050 [Ornithinimicrobium avium]
MQPAWLPTLRAGIGLVVILSAAVGIVLAWGTIVVALMVLWLALGVFLVWASRYERTGTTLDEGAITVVEGRHPQRLTRAGVLDLRTEGPAEHPWRIVAVLRDGRTLPLLGVPPGELDRLRRWHSQT